MQTVTRSRGTATGPLGTGAGTRDPAGPKPDRVTGFLPAAVKPRTGLFVVDDGEVADSSGLRLVAADRVATLHLRSTGAVEHQGGAWALGGVDQTLRSRTRGVPVPKRRTLPFARLSKQSRQRNSFDGRWRAHGVAGGVIWPIRVRQRLTLGRSAAICAASRGRPGRGRAVVGTGARAMGENGRGAGRCPTGATGADARKWARCRRLRRGWTPSPETASRRETAPALWPFQSVCAAAASQALRACRARPRRPAAARAIGADVVPRSRRHRAPKCS